LERYGYPKEIVEKSYEAVNKWKRYYNIDLFSAWGIW
jgi:hypothetical protein